MRKRTISSLILIATVYFVVAFAGKWATAVIFWLLASGGILECCNILKKLKASTNFVATELANLFLMACAAFAPCLFGVEGAIIPFCAFTILSFAGAAAIMLNPFSRDSQSKGLSYILMLSLITMPLLCLVLLGAMFEKGFAFAIWIVVVTKFTDIGGYIFGVCFGNHKILPKVSPGKSYEGLIGGMLSSAVMGAFFAVFFAKYMPPSFGAIDGAIFGALLGFLGLVSDLAESCLKRNANVKDSGNIIPGIGGAFDLLDSLIASSPVGFLIAIYFYF